MSRLEDRFPEIQKGVPIGPHTSFKIGGAAKWFLVVKEEKDLIDALAIAREEGIRVFFLGGGSNVLVSSKGFDGLVIKNEMRKLEVRGNRIWAQSGVILAVVIKEAKDHGLMGIAALQGVPGTFGAGVRGNVGVPNCELGDFLVKARILDEEGDIKEVDRDYFEYGYRWSKLKANREVILDAEIELTPGGDPKEIQQDMMAMLKARKAKQPWGQSCGSYFKNPEGAAAGYYLDKAGAKGTKVGGAEISDMHANFFLNKGGATSEDVRGLAEKVKGKVKEKFGLELEEEVEWVE